MKAAGKQKILIFYDFFSPAYKAGGPIRSLNNLSGLLRADFDIFIFTAATDMGGAPILVEPDKWVDFQENVQVFYASKPKLSIPKIYNTIKNIRPDAVYINGLFTPYAVLFPLLALKAFQKWKDHKILTVLAPRGMLQKGALELKAGKKKIYLNLFKFLGLHEGITWHATDKQERRDIYAFAGPDAAIKEVSNVPVFPLKGEASGKGNNLVKVVTISLVARKKNHHFFLDALRKLPQKAEVQYDIFGPVQDEDYLHILQEKVKELPANIKVTFKGPVLPDQVQAVLQQYDCFVLPTLGENFGHAIFEAMGAGLPVLISDQTPWRNLENRKAGWDLPLQEQLWIDKLTEIAATEDAEWQQWQEGAYLYAVEHLKKQNFKEQYLELFGVKL